MIKTSHSKIINFLNPYEINYTALDFHLNVNVEKKNDFMLNP